MRIHTDFEEQMYQKLLEERKRLESQLQRFATPTGVSGDYEVLRRQEDDLGNELSENAIETAQFGDDVALELTLESKLKDVLDALERLGTGAYGVCQKCAHQIEQERLTVYPAARLCGGCAAVEG